MKVTFRPSCHGVAQFLGELESRVMEELWRTAGCTARDIRKRLSQKRSIAATTVLTVLDRLAKKGLVKRRKQAGAYLFFPSVSQQEFDEMVTRNVLAGLLEKGSRPILSTFVDLLSGDEGQLRELEELVRRKRK